MERGDPTWYIKFGAFKHMTSVGDLMCDLDKTLNIFKVRSSREHAHFVLSKCTIDVQTPIGEIKTIRKVLHVPSLKKSLLLVGFIINQGHVVVFIISGCHIVNKTSNCVVAKAMRDKENGLYRLQLFTPQVVVNVIKTSKTTTLWHRRLGHLNYQSLYHMSEKKMVVGVPKLSNVIEVCPSCQVGKQYRE